MIITYKKAYPCKAGKHEGGQPGKHAAIPQVPVLQLLQRRLRLPRHRPKKSCETPSKGPESTAEDPLFERSSLKEATQRWTLGWPARHRQQRYPSTKFQSTPLATALVGVSLRSVAHTTAT